MPTHFTHVICKEKSIKVTSDSNNKAEFTNLVGWTKLIWCSGQEGARQGKPSGKVVKGYSHFDEEHFLKVGDRKYT